MRSSRSRTKFLFEQQLPVFIGASRSPRLVTLTPPDNLTAHEEAARRFKPVSLYLKRKHRKFLGVWQRQKRGAWHVHLVVDDFVDVVELRSFAMSQGWGPQLDITPILKQTGSPLDGHLHHAHRGASGNVVKYLSRYLSRDLNEEKGVQLVVRCKAGRVGNCKFGWVHGAGKAWRLGRQLWEELPKIQRHYEYCWLGRRRGMGWREIDKIWNDAASSVWKNSSEILRMGWEKMFQQNFEECADFFAAVAGQRILSTA